MKQKQALNAIQKLAKWHRDEEEFWDTVEQFQKHPTDTVAAPPVGDGYQWQMATTEIKDSMFLTEEEARERLETLKRELEEGIGMPTATDGSKGQWRAAKRARIKTLEWLLE